MDRARDALLSLFADSVGWVSGLLDWIQDHPRLLGIAGVLAVPAALFWLWMYAKRVTMDRPHHRLMVKTFLIGMFSVFPVLWINYVLVHFLGFDTNVFIYQNVAHRAYFWVFFAFMIVAVNEELAKHFIVRHVDYKRREFNRIADGIEFSVAAALGFAFVENITYFIMARNMYEVLSPEFVQVVIFRSLGSMLAHTIFSGFYGYYYGRARFVGVRKDLTPKRVWNFQIGTTTFKHARRLRDLLLWRKSVHLEKDLVGRLHEQQLVAQGLFIAMFLHSVYNFLLEYGKVYLTVPLIAIEYMFIVRELHKDRNLDLHLFSRGGTSVVSRITEDGELFIEDPEVNKMLQRWDEYGLKQAAIPSRLREQAKKSSQWEGHPAEEAREQEIHKHS